MKKKKLSEEDNFVLLVCWLLAPQDSGNKNLLIQMHI